MSMVTSGCTRNQPNFEGGSGKHIAAWKRGSVIRTKITTEPRCSTHWSFRGRGHHPSTLVDGRDSATLCLLVCDLLLKRGTRDEDGTEKFPCVTSNIWTNTLTITIRKHCTLSMFAVSFAVGKGRRLQCSVRYSSS